MAKSELNVFDGYSKYVLKQNLHKLNYFRSNKQFEQYKMFYRRKPKQRNFRNDLDNLKPRVSDTFSLLKKDNAHNLSEKVNEYSTSYLHTPGITFGIRPGLGKPIHICDCSKPVTAKNHYIASNSVLTALVSIQYLTLICTTYCHKKLKAKRNKHAKQSNAIGN